MPTCSTSHLRSSRISHRLLRANNKPRASIVWPHRGSRVKWASTAVVPAQKPSSNSQQPLIPTDVSSSHNRALTTLFKAVSFLPRVLPSTSDGVRYDSASVEFWERLLRGAQMDLNEPASESVARVVVYGCDEFSGARDIVTALLEEPFSSDSLKQAVRERWKVAETAPSLTIKYGSTQPRMEDSGVLSFRSSWLQQFSLPTELRELPHRPGSSAFTPLFAADIPIIVCNPVTTPLSAILSDPSLPLNHSNAILVVNSSEGPIDFPSISHKHFPAAPPSLTVLFADSKRALNALDILSSNPSSAINIQRYQDGFTESNLSSLTSAVAGKLSATSSLPSLRVQNALQLLQDSFRACHFALKDAAREVDSVHINSNALRDEIAELKARVGVEVFGSEGTNEVKSAVDSAKKQVKVAMDRLTWWRLLWRVDDVATMVSAAVNGAWCRELEDKLIYHSGRLSASQKAFTRSSEALLCKYPSPSPFHSPILQNTLSQLESSPTFPLTPASLTTPIHNRRNQLAYPTNSLHRTAQRVTLGMGGSVLGGMGVAWAGWAGQLGILGSYGAGMEVESAAGVGMLGAAIGVRWAVGKWERAKRKWWKDWDRVGEGLERDLRATLDRVVDEQVVAVPENACSGLCELARKRKDEIENLREEVFVMEDESGVTRSLNGR